MKRINSIIWGIALIAVGTLLALNAFEITNIDIFFDGWWTLFIIIPSLAGLFTKSDKISSVIGLIIGTILLLACQNVLDFDVLWRLIVPVIITVIGVKMIFSNSRKEKEFFQIRDENKDSINTACAVFSGQDIVYDNEVFRGAELNAIFGGIKFDLRNAIFEGDTVVNTCCIFGGADIILPDNVNIKVNSNSIFGGIDSKKHRNSNDNIHTVYLNGTCIFGGVDVK